MNNIKEGVEFMGFEQRRANAASEVNRLLDSLLSFEKGVPAERLYEAVRYAALDGGKRLRPYLVYEFCSACGGDAKSAGYYAAGIEMVHAFSLVHDDLPAMDNDVLRRGKPTAHVAFGEPTAILAGDALLIKAFETVASNPFSTPDRNNAALKVLAYNSGVSGMTGGQQLDLEGEGKKLSADDLSMLSRLKTGALIGASCELGCIAAGADEKLQKAASSFGFNVGLAFQIKDDLLDLTATSEQLGKTPGKDVKSGKATFPSLLGEAQAYSLAEKVVSDAITSLEVFGENEAVLALREFCRYTITRKK